MDYRVRYAIRCIMRDQTSDEGAFKVCFEMEDEEQIIRRILRRGLTNARLRSALEKSHLIDLTHWLQRFADLAEKYNAAASPSLHGWRIVATEGRVKR